jgi:hypothetical protein
VRVHYGEGVAIHIDPESCAVSREGIGEALTGERIGQPSSRESDLNSGADTVLNVEGDAARRVNRERLDDPAWSETLACAYASCAGTGRSHGRPTAMCVRAALARIGKVRSHSR